MAFQIVNLQKPPNDLHLNAARKWKAGTWVSFGFFFFIPARADDIFQTALLLLLPALQWWKFNLQLHKRVTRHALKKCVYF